MSPFPNTDAVDRIREIVDSVYRSESRAVLATLIRLLGDFDKAEEALHEAFRLALEKWTQTGIPDNPRAWLVTAGRFKAIDQIRRLKRFDALDADVHDVAVEESSLTTAESVADVGSSRVDLQACKLEYSIVSPK